MPSCQNSWCKKDFTITEEDRRFAARFGINFSPSICSICRHQSRALFKGSLVFRKRTSSLSGKPVISCFHAEAPFPVYSIEEWWSDSWDALDYGRALDLTEYFFHQFSELFHRVPRMANFNENTENSEYCSHAGQAKNAYYSDVAFFVEDVYYCDTVTGNCNFLADCLQCFNCNYLIECVQCRTCAQSTHLWLCNNCRDCHFCFDCQGCSDCLFCTNQRNKKYCIRDVELTPEAYQREKAKLLTGSYEQLEKLLQDWNQFVRKSDKKAQHYTNCEDCVGDTLSQCSNCYECYECMNCEDCRLCSAIQPSKQATSCMELTSCGNGELIYNSINMGRGNYFCRMCSSCRGCSGLTYCVDCFTSENCFGCIGLRNKKYCILNVQLSKEEYLKITEQIIQVMTEAGDWGNFFPKHLSPFAYNESNAQALFPIDHKTARTRGFNWAEIPEVNVSDLAFVDSIPDLITDVSSEITKQVLRCSQSGRPFRVLATELELYRNLNYPIPRQHPDLRMSRRRRLLRKWELKNSNCDGCGKSISTSLGDMEHPILCESCYLAKVY